MKLKITFDTNFFDRFHSSAPAYRSRIFSYVQTGKLECYISGEVLREVMGLSQTKRPNLIIPFAKDILKLTSGKILYDIDDMLASEFCGSFQLLMEEERRKQIIKFLEQAASGHIPSRVQTIGQLATKHKQVAKKYFDRMYLGLESLYAKMDAAALAEISFDKIQEEHWSNCCKRTVHAICTGCDIPDPDKVSDAVFNNEGSYPHFRTYMKIFVLLLYKYLVLRRKREKGDLFDFRQMLYLQDMDVYVTDDRKLQDWYHYIFGNTRQVITAEKFLVSS